jgi:fucose permease
MHTAESSNLRLTVFLSAGSFGVLGACLTLPGTFLPLLVEQFGIRLVEAGSMLALQPVAYLIAVLAAGRLIHRFGMRAVLSLGLLASAAGIAGFGLMSGWLGGAAMMFVTGLGFGVMEVGTNSLLITAGGARRSNLLNFAHLFFGVGSFMAPVAAAHVVAAGVSWRVVFQGAGGVTACVAVGWRFLDIDAAPAQRAASARSASGGPPRLALLFALMLALYVGAEMGIGGWLTKYMVTARGTTLTFASNVLSLYWMGLAAGRLLLSALSHHVREQRLIVWLSLMAAIALASALVAGHSWTAAICFGATGMGFSGIFPAVVALGGRYHPHNVAGATSVMIAGAGIGGIVIPWTMSAIADGAGLVAGMTFYAVACAAMAALAILMLWTLPVHSED